jgi:hypothetical protein
MSLSIRLDQHVHQLLQLIWGKLGGGARVQQRGVVDVIAFAGEGGFDGVGVDVDVGLLQGGELWRQRPDVGGLDGVAGDSGDAQPCSAKSASDSAMA